LYRKRFGRFHAIFLGSAPNCGYALLCVPPASGSMLCGVVTRYVHAGKEHDATRPIAPRVSGPRWWRETAYSMAYCVETCALHSLSSPTPSLLAAQVISLLLFSL
jgi:hypothetical protein